MAIGNRFAWFALLPASVALVAITLSIKKNISETNKLPLNTLILGPRTALLIVGFGFLVNAGYASMVAWLAPFYQSLGMPSAQKWLISCYFVTLQASAALIIPFLAAKIMIAVFGYFLTLTSQLIGFFSADDNANERPLSMGVSF